MAMWNESRIMRSLVLWFTVLSALAVGVSGAPPPTSAVQRMVEDYLARRMTPAFAQRLTLEEAREVQEVFIKKLQPELGRPVGQKVGLVSRTVQARWGVDQPVRGVLLEKMLLPDNSE